MSAKSKKSKKLPTKFHQLFDALAKRQDFIARMAFAALTDAEKTRVETIIDFKKAAFERAEVLGSEVWENWDFVKDVFFWSPVEPSKDVLAALTYPTARTWAIGRKVLQRASQYTLLVSFRAMELTPLNLDRVLKHELLHIGYSGHDERFRAACREVGAAIAGGSATGEAEGVFFEQRQQNGRYARTGPFFSTEQEAIAWFRDPVQMQARQEQAVQWLAANPGKGMNDVRRALMWRIAFS